MEVIFENNVLIFEQNINEDTFVYTWKSSSENLDIDAFLIEAQRILEGILNSKCKSVIGNDIDFFVVITPDVQEKINETMLTNLNGIITKFAHVVSKDLFSRVSVEQLFDENKEGTYEDKYFDTMEEAATWIQE